MRIPEQSESLYDRAMKSLDLTPKTKAEFERCREYCRDYRKKQETIKLLKGEDKKKGHDEGFFWKSHATAELVAKMENAKYVLHQPFNRQIKKMAQYCFPMAAAMMDDWH